MADNTLDLEARIPAFRFDRRILIDWLIGLGALWLVLTFVFHAAHPALWIGIIVVAILVNAFIATYLDDDGG